MIGVQCLGSYGRLGNQMFQYATGYALAKKHNTRVIIPKNEIYGSVSGSQLVRTFELSSALIDKEWETIRYSYQEPDFSYQTQIERIPDNTNISGYFQSEKYFLNCRNDLINQEFQFKADIVARSSSLLENIRSVSNDRLLCSLHVRLGDYIKLSNVHNNLSLDYYEQAIKEQESSNPYYLVFSDDIKLARKMLLKVNKDIDNVAMFIDADYDVTLYLMSICKLHIIANSSFSWWGAWISDSQKTVAPKKWFEAGGPKNWQDVYCKDWVVI